MYTDGESVSNLSSTDGDTVILYAKWANSAVVTFNANDGSEPPATTTQIIPFTEETALTANSFERTDYVFIGWNTRADGTGDKYSDGQKVTLTKSLDLYAQWAIDLVYLQDKTSWTDGNVYSMSASLTGDSAITSRITVSGSVTLILPDGLTLNAVSGITVTDGNTLILIF